LRFAVAGIFIALVWIPYLVLSGSGRMWIFPTPLTAGGWAALAWFGAQEPLQTTRRKATYGFLALASGIGALVAFKLHA
jgi:hypothetical protein